MTNTARTAPTGQPGGEESRTLPVFPLSGVVLLPEGELPLHVFEPRYRNLVRDVLDGDGEMGMIQPREPAAADSEIEDREAAAGKVDDAPPLYQVGCVGTVEKHEQLADGRYLILLRGQRRFRNVRELEPHDGYRRLAVRCDDFADTPEHDPVTPAQAADLLEAVQALAAKVEVSLDVERLQGLSARSLVHTLAMGLPFSPAEKQALLECPTATTRIEAMTTLFEMGFDLRGNGGEASVVTN